MDDDPQDEAPRDGVPEPNDPARQPPPPKPRWQPGPDHIEPDDWTRDSGPFLRNPDDDPWTHDPGDAESPPEEPE